MMVCAFAQKIVEMGLMEVLEVREKVKVFAESDTTMVLIKPVAYGSDEDF